MFRILLTVSLASAHLFAQTSAEFTRHENMATFAYPYIRLLGFLPSTLLPPRSATTPWPFSWIGPADGHASALGADQLAATPERDLPVVAALQAKKFSGQFVTFKFHLRPIVKSSR